MYTIEENDLLLTIYILAEEYDSKWSRDKCMRILNTLKHNKIFKKKFKIKEPGVNGDRCKMLNSKFKSLWFEK